MARILVTGAAGFIGFHVSQALLAQGHEVVGLDNFNEYYPVQLKRDRWAQLLPLAGFTGREADLCEHEALLELLGEHRVELVCHLAAQAGVRYSLDHPFVYQKSNLEGFLSMLEACRHTPSVRRLVYASSSSVYGGNASLPFRESDRVDAPISLYAATKKANELMAHVYSHLYGLQTVGLRFFTVYGPWGRPDMAMWMFSRDILAGKPIKVFNHGRMQRDFTYIDDIVGGVLGSLLKPDLERYEVLNLGNHRAEDLMTLIRLLGESLGVEPKLEMLPMQPGDVPATWADIDLARRKLGYDPCTRLEAGVPRFCRWFLDYRSRPQPAHG